MKPSRLRSLAAPLLLGALTGCSGYTGPRSVANEDPAVKIPEIRKAVDAGDRSVMPQLVKDLDNDDAAVRLYAIGALQRLTGETFGYDWTQSDRAVRRPAIEQWRAHLESSEGRYGGK